MTIQSETFDGDLPGLAEALSSALPAIAPNRLVAFAEEAEPTLIGPFAAYSADPRTFVENGEAERGGWRGLVMHAEAPLAVVDVHLGEEAGPSYGFRGSEPAEALAEALAVAQRYEDGETVNRVRWLTLPEIYVTALWLTGPANLFITTRMGSAERPPIEVVGAEDFLGRVRALIALTARNDVRPAEETGSVRSGMRARD
ncbi:hypothetical protein [Sphingomonas sp. T9W2]|uniref:hypothetical protein n=1 Tax=Sphingomonas sp. T9W2 TaxID=3143183 RepID=UPI0031F51EDB